ncbi:MAG TPA: hypothetical protein VEP50_05815 [bacterium]|nr:hypothetical protein [bacterium]
MEPQWRSPVVWRRAGTGIAGLVVAASLLHAAVASAAATTVGVVDFYAPTPVPVIGAVIPERTAADELSALLAHAGSVTVVSRAEVARAETAMGWRPESVLSFGQLGALARAVGADRLVVGWITMLSVPGAGGAPLVPDGNGIPLAQAAVVVQVFDTGQGRIVAETRQSASDVGVVPEILVRDVLRNALAPAVPWLLAHFVPASMRATPGCCE